MARYLWILSCAALASCFESPQSGGGAPHRAPSGLLAKSKAAPSAANGTLSYACSGNNTLQFGAPVPPDFSQVSSDLDADCFGWQELISLNASAGSTAGFGDPGDTGPVAWQGYMNNHQLFQPDGSPPPAWGTPPTITGQCLSEAGLAEGALAVPLTMSTKFWSELESGDGKQAAPPNAPSWLGDTRGNNVWYEIRVSEGEYESIVGDSSYNLYSREGQEAWYANPQNPALALSAGSWSPPQVGSLELKAAWIEVDDPGAAKWASYKLTLAVVVDASTQKCRALTVALVGLHIIHKTQSQPTWIWASFEHVDNAPDNADAASTTKTWSFFDPKCQAKTVSVPAACQYKHQAKVSVGCDASAWNVAPQYWLGEGCPDPEPIQVTRLTPIDANARAANQAAWQAIGEAYPSSVWRNYQLVDVQWSTNPPSAQPRSVPQTVQSLQPDGPFANTVLETYAQHSKCVDCHQNATISGSATLPSDFSFLLQEAQPKQLPRAKLGKASSRPKARRIIN